MKITREKACQRLHHRVSTPLHVLIAGKEYSASDWSLGGLRVTNWDQWQRNDLLGEILPCKFELPFQGFNIAFEVETEVVRASETNTELGLKFLDLDDRQIELLNHFVEQLVRGSMTSIEDTILRIDSPVTPVSTKPDPSPAHQVPVHRFPMKMLAMSTVYAVIGMALMFLIGITVYENFLNIKVKSAFTASPIEPLTSLVDGRIRTVNTPLHTDTASGETLLSIESPNIVKRIEEAKIFIEQKQLELEAHRKRHVLAIETSGSAASKEAQLHQIEIDLVQQEVALAMQNLVALYDYRDDLSVVSPSDGRLVQLLKKPGSFIKRGEILAIFERKDTPKVLAYVSEHEARALTLNLIATVRLLNANQQWHGRITRIHVPTLYSSAGEQTIHHKLDATRPVQVEIQLPESFHRQLINLGPGLPIEVLFPTTRFSAYLQEVLSEDFKQERDNNYTPELDGSARVSSYGEVL